MGLFTKKKNSEQESYAQEIKNNQNKEYRKQLYQQREEEKKKIIKQQAKNFLFKSRLKPETTTNKIGRYGKNALRFLSSPAKTLYNANRPTAISSSSARSSSVNRNIAISRPVVNVRYGKGRYPRVSGRKYGRTRGTFDQRYKQFGGVWEYRKVLSAELARKRLEDQRNAQLTPEEQMILQRARQRAQARRQNPENQIFPDTNGFVDTDSIMREIEEAADIVP